MTTSSNATEISVLFSELQQQFSAWRANRHKPYRVPVSLRKLVLNAIDSGLTRAQLDQIGVSGNQIIFWRKTLATASKQLIIKTPRFVECKPLADKKTPPTNKSLCSTPSNDELISMKLIHPNGLHINIEPCRLNSAIYLLQALLNQGDKSCCN